MPGHFRRRYGWANHAHTFESTLIQLLASIIGAGIIALSVLLTYHYANRPVEGSGTQA